MSKSISTELLLIAQNAPEDIMQKLIMIASEIEAIDIQNKRLREGIYEPSNEELQIQKDKIKFLKKHNPKNHILYFNELEEEYNILVREYENTVKLYNTTYNNEKKKKYDKEIQELLQKLNTKRYEIEKRIENDILYGKVKRGEVEIIRRSHKLSDNLINHHIINKLIKIAENSPNSNLFYEFINIINRVNPILKNNLLLKKENYLKYIQTLETHFRPNQQQIEEQLQKLKEFSYGFF